MTKPIEPGDWVECVEVDPSRGYPVTGFRVGGLYVVEDVGFCSVFHEPWLTCVGMPVPRDLCLNADGWAARAFRPIHRPDASLIENLMKGVGVPQENIRHLTWEEFLAEDA